MMNKVSQVTRYASPSGALCKNVAQHDLLLCDISASTRDEGFERGRNKIQSIAEACGGFLAAKYKNRPEDCVAVVAYDHDATICCKFKSVHRHFNEIDDAIKGLPNMAGGGTELCHGLKAATKLVRSLNGFWSQGVVPVRILAYSDGYDMKGNAALRRARKLKSSGVFIETFGVGRDPSDVDERFLKGVASNEDGFVHYRFLGDGEAMRETFATLATGMLTVDD